MIFEQKRLDELGTIITGKTPSTKNEEFWDGEIPFVTPKDIQGTKHIFETERYITHKGLNSVKGARLPIGAICVSCIGNIGYLGITMHECVSNQQINSLIVNEDNDKDYVYYLLKSMWPYFKNYEGQSTTLSILNKTQFSKIIVEVPSLPNQKKIASILSKIDDKIELNNKINNNLAEQAMTLFKHYYDHATDEVNFTDLIQILGGGTPKTSTESYWNGEIPFFTPKDVGNPYVLTTEKYITDDGLAHCNSRLYPINTVFVTARGTVGKVSMPGVPMAMNQSCYALVGKEIPQLLVYFYTMQTVAKLKHKAMGAVFDAITTRDFETEQIKKLDGESIMSFISAVEPIYGEILALTKECQQLSALRDALLPKLMSGELDVSEVEI